MPELTGIEAANQWLRNSEAVVVKLVNEDADVAEMMINAVQHAAGYATVQGDRDWVRLFADLIMAKAALALGEGRQIDHIGLLAATYRMIAISAALTPPPWPRPHDRLGYTA